MTVTKEMSDAFKQAVGGEISCGKAKKKFQELVGQELEDLDFIVAQFAAIVDDASRITDHIIQIALNDLLRASGGNSHNTDGRHPI